MTIADRTQGFSIQVAADLYGKKENLCIQLGDRSPPLGDLVAIIEAVYEAEAYSLKPDGVAPPRFQIQYMQSFDEVSGWEDITTAQQIHDGMQLFVFQPRNDVHSDSQDLIPVAKQPVLPFPYLSIVETPSAATPSALGSPLAGNSIINEKAILDTFKRLDKYAAGTVGMNVVRNGFAAMGVDLTASTIASLFGLSAPKGPVDNREVDLDDWFAFATTHPKIIRSLNQYPAEIIKERQREKHRAKLTGDNHSSDAQRRVRQHIQERRATANNLQRAHKETNARSQAAAAERLARGKSCVVREVEGGGGGGGGGDDSHVKSRRGIETQKPVAWKPAGLKRTTSPSATTTYVPNISQNLKWTNVFFSIFCQFFAILHHNPFTDETSPSKIPLCVPPLALLFMSHGIVGRGHRLSGRREVGVWVLGGTRLYRRKGPRQGGSL